MIWILPAIFVLVNGPEGESARKYEGQSQATIASLLAGEGKTGQFITQQQYDAFVAANIPVRPSTPAEILAAQREEAIRELTEDAEGRAKFIRAVLLTILDEINLLRQRDRDRSADVAAATSLADLKTRWAARSALSDRTPAQARTSVTNKINSGASD